MSNPSDIFDGRTIPCSEKHSQIIKKWRELPVGGTFILVNDHDPLRLKKQFGELWPETFDWKYLKQAPHEYHVQITKLKPLPEHTEIASLSCGH